MVGDLYPENDKRRDSGFSIFYMGINVGALLAASLSVTSAKQIRSKHLPRFEVDPTKSWH